MTTRSFHSLLSCNVLDKKGALMETIEKTASYMDDGFYARDTIPLCDSVSLWDIPEYARNFQKQCNLPNNYYTNIYGDKYLLDTLKLKASEDNILFNKEENILITAGAYNGFSALCHALCDPGDVILTFSPTYILFATCVQSYGAELVTIPSKRNDMNFKVTSKTLQEKIDEIVAQNRKIKALLIVNPTNVDGAFWTKEEIDDISETIKKNELLIIEDRVYDELYYDTNSRVPSFFAEHPDLAYNTITLDSISKRYGGIQWRIGWLYGPKEIITAAREYVVNSLWSPISHFQRSTAHMISAGLKNTVTFPEDISPTFPQFFQEAQKHKTKQELYISTLNKGYQLRRDICMLIINGEKKYQTLKSTRPNINSINILKKEFEYYLKEYHLDIDGISGTHTPVLPESAMFLLFEVKDAVFELMPETVPDKAQFLTRLIYQNTKVVLLPPAELTLPEGNNFYRLEFGVAPELLFEGLKRLKDFMCFWMNASEAERAPYIEHALNTLPEKYRMNNDYATEAA